MWRTLYFHNGNFERGMQRALRSGVVRINAGSGLVEIAPGAHSLSYDSNWLFFGHHTASRDCFLWHQIMFECFDRLVPEFCKLRCYKVVIKVRNFLEAIQFYNAILSGPQHYGDLMPIQGKVGVDERDYSDGHFNAFIYCDGLSDSLDKYRYIRRLVDEQIPTGREIKVIIKRSCTEMEREHGPTNGEFWQSMTDDERDLQHRIEDIFLGMKSSSVQPDWLKNRIITKMARWANACGDKSWINYFEGNTDFLTVKAITYHHLAEQEKGDTHTPTTTAIVPKPKPKQKKRR
jgi:hypothetical protein